MRRFFIGLFVVSLLAAGGAYYWRTQFPEGTAVHAPAASALRSAAPGEKARTKIEKAPSERQDLAMTVSLVSSVISAVAAVAQAWFTRRALKA